MSKPDADLVAFGRSIIEAARHQWGNEMVSDPGSTAHPQVFYSETHYALAAVLLYLLERKDRSQLDLAESRLRLWSVGTPPTTFFNAMAICITAIVFKQSGEAHAGLQAILDELLSKTHEHRDAAFTQWAGNNVYLQQVCVDCVLLPLARGERVRESAIAFLAGEFRRYRTPEGFYFDLPRTGTDREPLLPPTYVMKMLFLAGVCHELHQTDEMNELFQPGIVAALPLLSNQGTLSYFGRTDNSPFASGLTVFNLRKGARQTGEPDSRFENACDRAEHYYRTSPRTPYGMLLCNRFADAKSDREFSLSKDVYAQNGEYSLASCAYALLGCLWFPRNQVTAMPKGEGAAIPAFVSSRDLAVTRQTGPGYELLLRTRGEITGWDRRYIGPTILRYQIGEQTLVGAISRRVSTDHIARESPKQSRVARAANFFQDWLTKGAESLDGTTVGFVPVIRDGAIDYLPGEPLEHESTPSTSRARHRMVRVHTRGFHNALIETVTLLHNKLPGLKPKEYVRPRIRPANDVEFTRVTTVNAASCRVVDTLAGDLRGRQVLFSVRYLPGAAIRVDGLRKTASLIGWGSEGRQVIDVYEAQRSASDVRYEVEISLR